MLQLRAIRRVGLGVAVLALAVHAAVSVLAPTPAVGATLRPGEAVRQASATPGPAPVQAPAQVPRALQPFIPTTPIVPADPAPPTPPPFGAPLPPGPTSAVADPSRIMQARWLWQRTEYSNDFILLATDPAVYTISLQADGRLSLRADCNRGTGTYTVSGSQLTLTPGAMTLAACQPGSQDDAFLRDLRNVVTYVLDGENLVLNLRADGGNMVFAPQPAPSLVGQEWRVTGYNNGRGGVVSVLPDVPLTATFGDDGSVSGNSGCNLYRGPYTLDGSAVSIGNLVSTRRACLSEPLNVQEQAFLAALKAAATYELVGDRLTLRDAEGAQQVGLVRPTVEPPAAPGPPASPSPPMPVAPASEGPPPAADAPSANASSAMPADGGPAAEDLSPTRTARGW